MMAAATPKGILKTEERVHKKNTKKARLIVRNLSFKVSEPHLKSVFSKYGVVTEVNIPTKSDGKKRGFAFIQFDTTKSAIKAINGLNSKNILNRPVAVDFAVCKSLYEASNKNSELEVVDESFKPEEKQHATDSDDDVVVTGEKKDSGYDSDKEKSDTEEEEDSESDNDAKRKEQNDPEEGSSDEEVKSDDQVPPRKRVKRDPDAGDGRTLFIRNVSFQSQEEDLEELMEEFGEVDYAVLCHDSVTELPKGTGFVRFSKIESAQECMNKANDSLQGGVMLDGRQLNFSLALVREDAEKMSKKQPKEGKDRRNLYLSREGLVRQGTQAAEGVSKPDMALRSRLEYRKRNALRNFQFFVSNTRLCIHNLPPSYESNMLRKLFLKAVDDYSAKITEARVMKDQKGLGKSKGFGFVEFTEHEHALKALRTLNNNPDVFTSQRRPIVEFSVENRNAINAKLKRQEKSKLKNAELKENSNQGRKLKPVPVDAQDETVQSGTEISYSGFKSKKDVKNLPSHFGPKVRHKKNKPVKEKKSKGTPAKKKEKESHSDTKEVQKKKKNSRRKGRKGQSDVREEKAFQMLVNKYKGKLSSVPEVQKQKWYEAD